MVNLPTKNTKKKCCKCCNYANCYNCTVSLLGVFLMVLIPFVVIFGVLGSTFTSLYGDIKSNNDSFGNSTLCTGKFTLPLKKMFNIFVQ